MNTLVLKTIYFMKAFYKYKQTRDYWNGFDFSM
jgi:hypothetical protein